MSRRRITPQQRAKIFTNASGVCHICGGKIGGSERWDVEHVISLSMGGDDDFANMRPAHVTCHREKTTSDAGNLAKARRVEAKHIGAHRPKQRINPRRVRQCDIPVGEKLNWRARKDARGESDEY
jgi:5-methylcytosine-specific restriction endonuclease McrA